MEEEIIKYIFTLLFTNETGIISNTIWLFANLIDNDELLNIILQFI